MLHSSIELLSYTEDQTFLCTGDPEPSIRQQRVIFSCQNSRWHVTVAFNSEGDAEEKSSRFSQDPIKHKLRRRDKFRYFISRLQIGKLTLLDDTMTKVELKLVPTESALLDRAITDLLLQSDIQDTRGNRFLEEYRRLRVTIYEDGERILYPLYSSDSKWPPTIWLSELEIEEDITGAVGRFHQRGERTSYIFKTIDRPFYRRQDTAVIQRELENLKRFRSTPYIAQLSAVVVSPNPYQTIPSTDGRPVMRGILMLYYPGGTLEEWLKRNTVTDLHWQRWPLQICRALQSLHSRNIAHTDLKPGNIVIDDCENAVVIDISGIGGVTYEWRAPQIRFEASQASLEAEKRSDIWAYGKMMLKIAERYPGSQWLREIAATTMCESPKLRPDLGSIISELERHTSMTNLECDA
ncbi:hypothetical protein AYO20_08863 [Fonsecaea nubica]|uniref:Protein kinase domain-containing protein n=1 Tax=Fonsecaea nubica TaxID=856822 RepID=A0A178CKX1_9EURO|nr:hypothetical protein AYO20_08863 [Fonsecaea nubica]OAL30147.1 hypothetical protein AYO20_08863 [Fonsecaea nubica]